MYLSIIKKHKYEVLGKNPEDASTVLQVVDSLLTLERKEEALTVLNDAIASSEDADVSLVTKYVNLNNGFSNNDFSDEVELFSKAKGWPEDKTLQAQFIINNVSVNYFSKERLEAYGNYLLSQDTDDAMIAAELGYVYRNLGEYVKALEYMEKAKSMNSYENKNLLLKEIEVLHYAGDYHKAIEVATQAADLYEQETDFIYNVAFLNMLYNEKYEEAIGVGTDLTAVPYSADDGLELLYLTYFTKGDYESALQYVEEYLKVVDNSSYAKAYKLRILRELGQTDADLEKELSDFKAEANSANDIYIPAILGDIEKVKTNLASYLDIYPTAYTKASIAKNTAMREAIADPDIAAMLDLVVEETVEETPQESQTEETVAEESVSEASNKLNTGALAKTAASVVVMLLGVGIIVVNVRKSKKK